MGRLHGTTFLQLRPEGGEALAVLVAESRRQRLLGLAGLRTLEQGSALLIPRCRSVHTFGMRFALDVLFVTLEERSLRVHEARRGVPPCRIVRASRSARIEPGLAALELPSGRARPARPDGPAAA